MIDDGRLVPSTSRLIDVSIISFAFIRVREKVERNGNFSPFYDTLRKWFDGTTETIHNLTSTNRWE